MVRSSRSVPSRRTLPGSIPVALLVVALLAALSPRTAEAQHTHITYETDWSQLLGVLLAADGPHLVISEREVNASGVVRGGDPFIVDYELEKPGFLTVVVRVERGQEATFRLPADGSTPRRVRRQEIVHLPAEWGDKIQASEILVRAWTGRRRQTPFQLYGLGAGEKAVASMTVTDVRFLPPAIHLQKDEKANFEFGIEYAYNFVQVEVYGKPASGDSHLVWATAPACSLIPGQRCRGTWDGRDTRKRKVEGRHVLQVRAWAGETQGAGWNGAVSRDSVQVEP